MPRTPSAANKIEQDRKKKNGKESRIDSPEIMDDWPRQRNRKKKEQKKSLAKTPFPNVLRSFACSRTAASYTISLRRIFMGNQYHSLHWAIHLINMRIQWFIASLFLLMQRFSVQSENACEQKNPSAIQHAHLIVDVFFLFFCLCLLSLCESYRRWFRNVTHKESLANRFNRRKSVFAESFDPEGDDDEGEKVCAVCLFFNFVSYKKNLV